VTEQVRPRIEALLEAWRDRTTPKQRITGSRLHQELVGEGVRAGVTTVREVLREIRRRQAEVFVPLVHRPGDAAQVDFFEVTVEVAGERRKAWKFVMRLMHSGRDFAWVYERCDQVAFLDGHVRAFAHFGAVPQRCVYDNLSAAVRKVVFPKRVLTARFQALVSHYLFEPCFARPGEGHDKGGVEARGKAIRLQHLTPIPRAQSLAEIAQALLDALDRQAETRRDREGRTVLERFEAERRAMLPLPERAFDARKVVLCSVSRRSLVKVEGATYSVPSSWQGLEATAYVAGRSERRTRGSASGARRCATATISGSSRASPRHCARWRRSCWPSWASPLPGSGGCWSTATGRPTRRGCSRASSRPSGPTARRR
jgi:transposase